MSNIYFFSEIPALISFNVSLRFFFLNRLLLRFTDVISGLQLHQKDASSNICYTVYISFTIFNSLKRICFPSMITIIHFFSAVISLFSSIVRHLRYFSGSCACKSLMSCNTICNVASSVWCTS